MQIKFVEISNFRKLQSVRAELAEETTLFVGANNSGKTSAMLALRHFLVDGGRFSTHDFTLSHWQAINQIGKRWETIATDKEAPPASVDDWTDVLPTLDVWLHIENDEVHYVRTVLPTIKWEPGRIGIRLRFEPKDVEEFYIQFTTMKVAHMRLCASRAIYVRAYPRETQEMLFDAHARAFAFFGGVPTRGIYDNMKTAVTTVFTGKDRVFNRRFLVMASHYMVEPTACSPAAGWEKGQVEHQVQTARGRFFQPRLRFTSLEELNGWLEAECCRWGELRQHPEQKELTVAQALAAERPALQPMLGPFDGFHESEHAVTGTCLISFDRNRYSVMAKAGRRTVQVRAYADRIVVRCEGEVVADHRRFFGRDRTLYDPWHYLPVLATKPGALRNGAPFQDWELPPALARLRRKLGAGDEADRRFVRVLAAVLEDGLEPVEAAAREALAAGTVSDDVILNILARRREPPRPLSIVTPDDLALRHPPLADCDRYDSLRGLHAAA